MQGPGFFRGLFPSKKKKERYCKMEKTYIVAEAGINHNGSLDIAKKLIDVAAECGCDAVKFQKRTINVVYTPEELAKPRESIFGDTNGDLKRGLEFGEQEYDEIDSYCRSKGIDWFASCWDKDSVDFIARYGPPYLKIPSACLTDNELLKHFRKYDIPLILSTGMSDYIMIGHAVNVLGRENLTLMHCTSTYPADLAELNLLCISTLKKIYPDIPIGYSGHEGGLATTYAAAVLGAVMVERHITLSRMMFGTDQPASVEPQGLKRLVRDIRAWEIARGDGMKKIYDSERPIIKKLRRVI
jgi:N-acetylneuraminate synthase